MKLFEVFKYERSSVPIEAESKAEALLKAKETPPEFFTNITVDWEADETSVETPKAD